MTSVPPANNPRSQKIYTWALETRFEGLVDGAAVRRASEQWHFAGKLKVWLLDASPAEAFGDDALNSIPHELSLLKAAGLDRVAIVLPPSRQVFMPLVLASVKNLPMMPAKFPTVYPFNTRKDATDWLQRGCR